MNDFDKDFERYIKKVERRMYLGLVISVVVFLTALLIALICYKQTNQNKESIIEVLLNSGLFLNSHINTLVC